MSKEIKQTVTMTDLVMSVEEKFNAVQVVDSVTFAKEAQFALQALQNSDTKSKYSLLNVARNTIEGQRSLKNAIINVAAIGITLNPASKLAYLVPRDGKICLDISYQGLKKLATDCRSVEHIKYDLIYEKDVFKITGPLEMPIHEYTPLGERGELLGAYCIATTPDGKVYTTVMKIEEIEKIKKSSKAAGSPYSPWNTFYEEMVKKTVVKRAFKEWPKTKSFFRLENAIEVLNEHEGLKEELTAQKALEADVEANDPRTEEEKVIGDNYKPVIGKFLNAWRGKALGEIPKEDLEKYYENIERRSDKSPDQFEMIRILEEYFEIVSGLGE